MLSSLRYSPVNWLIIDWGFNGQSFGECGLPTPRPCEETPEGSFECSGPLPIQEAIDTYDWARWLPEVIVGIEDPDEDIAANYVREAAIEFCRYGRVLQREVVVELQYGVSTYPIFPYIGEAIVGVIGVKLDAGSPCTCSSTEGEHEGIDWQLDIARNELTLRNAPRSGQFKLLVWAAPTEDSCRHDVFLYDRFRADITVGARIKYVSALHFRDRALLNSLPPIDVFARAMLLAKTKAIRLSSSSKTQPGSGMWSSHQSTHYRHRR